ncbi:MAG: hypothetical protein Q8P88_02070 [Candidatus Jorgensenbacteria bacterium]|nr:hypothetical protein [Candidatus Jorgensenbacteria bacterium]
MRRGASTLVILTIFLLTSHGIGSFFSLYERISWFDMALHTLGGAWLASIFIVMGLPRYPSFFAKLPRLRYVLRVMFLVLIAGVLWELYEYGFAVWATTRFGNLGFSQPLIDTLSDLLSDAAGAAPVALFLFCKEREVS